MTTGARNAIAQRVVARLQRSEAKPRAGMRLRSNAAALRCAKGPLRCSISWPAEKLASLPAVVALKQSRRVRRRCARCPRAAMSSALLGAAYVAAVAHPPPALPAPPCPLSSKTTSVAARWAVPGLGDLWSGEKASPDTNSPVDGLCPASGRSARPDAACKASAGVGARSALRASDSPRLSERNERSECSEFRGATPACASQRSRHAVPTATVGAQPGCCPPRRADASREGSAPSHRAGSIAATGRRGSASERCPIN